MLKTLATITFLLLILQLNAQRFGATPPGVKWRQINTDTARIIYPAGLDSQATRVATILHSQAAKKSLSLGTKVRKINIVLQNETTISNGYVGQGPYRSEFYMTPTPDNFSQGSLGWADQLALHEYRHVQQYNNFEVGLSRVMRVLFGQEGYALATNASIPDWFYEGDAVHAETILSDQGRGRLPRFMSAYPALWKAGKKYSWMKLRNGSFKDFVPDHYRLGYLLVNYGYEKYGADFWQKVTNDAAAFKGLIYPFQAAIKRHTSKTYKEFLNEAQSYYKNQYADLAKGNTTAEAGPHPVLPLNKKVLTHYLFPYAVENDGLMYLKKANNRRPVFVLRDNTGEHWLRVRDIAISDQYSYRNGKVVYAAFESDHRWGWRDYSVIRMFDINSRQQFTLSSKSRYFTPDISPSGNKVVAVQNSKDGSSELHLIDVGTQEVTKRFRHPGVLIYTDPKFIDEENIVLAVRDAEGRMAFTKLGITTGELNFLTNPSYNVVGYPNVNGDYVYFSASYGGIDNIFRVPLNGGEPEEMESKWELGNYQANVANNKISWTAFTADGYQLQQTDLSAVTWKPVPGLIVDRLAVSYPVAQANSVEEILKAKTGSRQFASKPYSKSKGLFNFHSWRPYYEDPEFTFSIYGQNILNTLETQLYYLYNENERTSAAGVSAVYGKWFTHLNIGSQYTFGRQEQIGNRIRTWDQIDTRIGLSVPLSWAKKQTYRSFNVGSNLYYNREFNKGFYKDSLGTTDFFYLQHYVSVSEQVESAVQHFYPRLAYSLSLQYRHAITDFNSRQFLGTASLYFPGLASTHNLIFNAAWQETGTADVRFANRFPTSRGYNAAYFARIIGVRTNYHLPLFYPDFGFGNIVYLQRVRGNAFFDFAKAFDANKNPLSYQNSVGGEVFFDTKWWNQHELTFGIRVSRLLNYDFISRRTGETVFEFIMPVSILPR
ncbi:MAG: hypothetical protein NVV59_11255 [Chitinophagaceae bacterium]|nr:hypothetical protein [Chitinophagaceae bacterium]